MHEERTGGGWGMSRVLAFSRAVYIISAIRAPIAMGANAVVTSFVHTMYNVYINFTRIFSWNGIDEQHATALKKLRTNLTHVLGAKLLEISVR